MARQISLGVIIAWGRTIYGEFELLAGKSAPHDFIQLIIYKALTFSEDINKLDTVRAYHVSRPCTIFVSPYLTSAVRSRADQYVPFHGPEKQMT